jgi:hypothetical protein
VFFLPADESIASLNSYLPLEPENRRFVLQIDQSPGSPMKTSELVCEEAEGDVVCFGFAE